MFAFLFALITKAAAAVIGVMVALATAAPAPQAVSEEFRLDVATPTAYADGALRGARVTLGGLAIGRTLTRYAYAGETLCLSASAVPARPADAGYGWQVDVTPVAERDGALELSVTWRRLWERGDAVSAAPRSRRIALQPGERLTLDYLASEDRQDCSAVGMSLEVGLADVEQDTIVASELWLRRPDTTNAPVLQQHLRTRVGRTQEFFFDDIDVEGSGGAVQARVSGSVTPLEADGDVVRARVVLNRSLYTGERILGGSTTWTLDATPSEVVAFELPTAAPAEGPVIPSMSFQVRLRLFR